MQLLLDQVDSVPRYAWLDAGRPDDWIRSVGHWVVVFNKLCLVNNLPKKGMLRNAVCRRWWTEIISCYIIYISVHKIRPEWSHPRLKIRLCKVWYLPLTIISQTVRKAKFQFPWKRTSTLGTLWSLINRSLCLMIRKHLRKLQTLGTPMYMIEI